VALYAVYAPMLGRWFGVIGVAGAAAAFWNGSLLIQCLLLWFRLERPLVGPFTSAIGRVGLAAVAGGLLAATSARLVGGSYFARLLVGATAGTVGYAGALRVLRSQEWFDIVTVSRSRLDALLLGSFPRWR
jgi:hypothetical protein